VLVGVSLKIKSNLWLNVNFAQLLTRKTWKIVAFSWHVAWKQTGRKNLESFEQGFSDILQSMTGVIYLST
jgi:hypothetical protein